MQCIIERGRVNEAARVCKRPPPLLLKLSPLTCSTWKIVHILMLSSTIRDSEAVSHSSRPNLLERAGLFSTLCPLNTGGYIKIFTYLCLSAGQTSLKKVSWLGGVRGKRKKIGNWEGIVSSVPYCWSLNQLSQRQTRSIKDEVGKSNLLFLILTLLVFFVRESYFYQMLWDLAVCTRISLLK